MKKLRCILGRHKFPLFFELEYFVDEHGYECWWWVEQCGHCDKIILSYFMEKP